MASTVMQIRVDDELKSEAGAVFEQLGIDIPTAVRMFLRRSVLVNGIPFSMTLPRKDYKAERALRAMESMGDSAQRNGVSDLSLEEINREIAAARAELAERGTIQ